MSEVIIRFVHVSAFSSEKVPSISRVAGFIDAKNFFELQQSLGIDSNPRQPKKSSVTDDIAETLEKKPNYFHLMSKGLLISATSCKELERHRFKLSFSNNDYGPAGILDGGHNTFAIGRYMLDYVMDNKSDVKKIRDWPTYRNAWEQQASVLKEYLDDFQFLVPIEVLYPTHQDEDDSLREWGEAILDITSARNNNLQLTDSTKDNFQGLYDFLKETLPDELSKKIEWKTNDGGEIKVADVVAISLIALSTLPESVTKTKNFNPVQIYRSKQACVEEFRRILVDGGNGIEAGSNFTLQNEGVKSALSLTGKLLQGYDEIFCQLPEAYNANEGKFGRIQDVRIWDPTKAETGEKKYSRKPFLSKFFGKEAQYQYAEGYFVPLVVALRQLISYDDNLGIVNWNTDPIKFIEAHINSIVSEYATVIKMSKYEPQKIGKDRGSYQIAENAVRHRLPVANER